MSLFIEDNINAKDVKDMFVLNVEIKNIKLLVSKIIQMFLIGHVKNAKKI